MHGTLGHIPSSKVGFRLLPSRLRRRLSQRNINKHGFRWKSRAIAVLKNVHQRVSPNTCGTVTCKKVWCGQWGWYVRSMLKARALNTFGNGGAGVHERWCVVETKEAQSSTGEP